MEGTLKSLVLIRAKHLAESVTTPAFVADAQGTLAFFNEAAEGLLGRSFSSVGPLPADEWRDAFDVRNRDGTPFPLEAMPGWMALRRSEPTIGHLRFRAGDGGDRFVAVCAIPLFSGADRFEGALLVFWSENGD